MSRGRELINTREYETILRPTKKRLQVQSQKKLTLFYSVPKEIWCIIFSHLIPSKRDFFHWKAKIENMYNCRLVCKVWAKVLENISLWDQIISERGGCGEGLWNDLTYSQSPQLWGPSQNFVSPPSFFAQITMRGFKRQHTTLELLAKWFRTKRHRLLFQTLSPILTLSSYLFNKDEEYFEEFMDSYKFKYYDIAIHNESTYDFRFNHYWGENSCAILRFTGDCFVVSKPKTNSVIDSKGHIVFHCDQRGNYLEYRELIEGSNCYTSYEIKPIHIWFGVECMKRLWEGHDIFQYRPRYS